MTPKLTVNDVRHHAEEVRDIAKRDARHVIDDQATQTALIAGVAVLALVSLAFFMGSRRGAAGNGMTCDRIVDHVLCE